MKSEQGLPSILFVCTGNIFRSMAAEHALRAQLRRHSPYLVGSAGIEAKPQSVHPIVRARLIHKGIDPAGHVQRRLTGELIQDAALIIAMGHDHQAHIAQAFGRHAPLFNQVSSGSETPILDLHEALPHWERDLEAAKAYLESIVDHIWNVTPTLIARLPQFFG
jgi:protein-tyrosine phosphatase